MAIESLGSILSRMDYNLETGDVITRKSDNSKKLDKIDLETVQEKYSEAQKQNTESTLKAWDDHSDMVQKSQELRKVRDRKEAIKRRVQEHDDMEDELRAKMAIENANRTSMLEASAMKRKEVTDAA